MKFRLAEKTEAFASAYSAAATAWVDIGALGGDSFSVVTVVDVDTPSAKTFTADATTDILTASAHGLTLGLKLQVSNSGGALPTGLSVSTDYFAIPIDANTFYLADSLVHAQAGTPINITTNGTGTQTETPTALAGGTIKLQQANNTAYPVDLGSATNISADATLSLEKDRPTMRYVRAYITLTAGHISASTQSLVKGDLE